jgi:hypothetical protein
MARFGLPPQTISDDPVPKSVIAYISVRGSESVFDRKVKKLAKSAKAYHAKKGDRESVRRDLEKNGFRVLAESALGLSVSAPAAAYEDITGGKLQPVERLIYSEGGHSEYSTHLDIVGKNQPESLGVGAVKSKTLKVDGIVLEKPRVYHAVFPSPIPVNSPKFHLRVPADVAVALNAVAAHQQGCRGAEVLVAMPDSGWYRHPYFTAQGCRVQTPIDVVPETDRSKDPVGHGTGESANLFAVAPQCTLQPIRASNDQGDLVGAVAGFLKAKELAPKIITNSWGGDGTYPPAGAPDQADLAFATEIQDAIERGILVVFSAGNGQFSVEPQIPGVLAAGGVYMDQNGDCARPITPAAIKARGSTGMSFRSSAVWSGCSRAPNTSCCQFRPTAKLIEPKASRRQKIRRRMGRGRTMAGLCSPARRPRRLRWPAQLPCSSAPSPI